MNSIGKKDRSSVGLDEKRVHLRGALFLFLIKMMQEEGNVEGTVGVALGTSKDRSRTEEY
jgi:hypothetical protein